MTISTLPPAPSRADAANADTFTEIAETFVAALPVFSTQVNSTLTDVNAAAASAIASANFKGSWASLTGALAVPASVLHSSKLWLLVSSVADVTAHTPGVSASWVALDTIQNDGLGYNQTWQDVKASRAVGTTYTNSTSRPIMVYIFCYTTTDEYVSGTFYVGATAVGYLYAEQLTGHTSSRTSLNFVVPSGSTYKLENLANLDSGNILYWSELR